MKMVKNIERLISEAINKLLSVENKNGELEQSYIKKFYSPFCVQTGFCWFVYKKSIKYWTEELRDIMLSGSISSTEMILLLRSICPNIENRGD